MLRRFLPIVLVLPLVGWAFLPTWQFMVEKWSADPQYSHGFIVPLFAGYLAWLRRPTTAPPFRSAPVTGMVLLVLSFLMRAIAGGLLFHQLDAIAMIVALAGAVAMFGGGAMLRWLAPSLIFLVFMIPLPFELERNVGGPLRNIATFGSTYLLQCCGLPAIAEGNLILIDDVKLGVAEACSGLKMLLTFAAFSVGAVLLSRRSWFEKLLVLIGIVPIALVTNILRVTGMGIAHTLTTDASTTHTVHDVLGWLMMPVGLGLLGLELAMLTRLVVPPRNAREGVR
ncbi:MAG: exosortase/archaeosortase family protein [Gemmataceae bacterium]